MPVVGVPNSNQTETISNVVRLLVGPAYKYKACSIWSEAGHNRWCRCGGGGGPWVAARPCMAFTAVQAVAWATLLPLATRRPMLDPAQDTGVSSDQAYIILSMKHVYIGSRVKGTAAMKAAALRASCQLAVGTARASNIVLTATRGGASKGTHWYKPTGGGRSSNTAPPAWGSVQTHTCSARSVLSLSMKASSCAPHQVQISFPRITIERSSSEVCTSSPSTRSWPGQLLLWLPKLQAAIATHVDVSRLTHRKSHR